MTIWQQLRTVPNLLSLLRLALVPVFLVLILNGFNLEAVIVLIVASVTDYLDGYFARKLNQETRLGQLLDPAADRLYIFATLIGLSVVGYIPIWLPMIVVGRDLLLLFTYPILASRGYGPLPVHYLGKAGTFALLYAFPLLLIASAFPDVSIFVLPVAWAFAWWGIGLYWWAGFVYLAQVRSVVKSSPNDSARLGD
ncbi:MAG: CDP-alcohol phosphatidyltransferase family protein [Rhodoluna sp.]|nr:CDP-alcohol phosphatidyltransferase family protein [Rhodoluna sp.]